MTCQTRQPRFDVAPTTIMLSGDRLRLGTFKDLGRFAVTITPGDPEADFTDASAWIYLPKKHRKAYERACRAFNKIMDRHDGRHNPAPPDIDPAHENLRAAVLFYHAQDRDD